MINFVPPVRWIRLFPLFLAGFLLVSCISPAASVQPTASLATVSGPFSKNLPASTPHGSLVEETEHFTIYYPEGEQASASFIGIVLEESLEKVSTDLHFHPGEKFKVFIYPDFETFHEAVGMPDAPEWVIATGYVGGIQMVTPRLISGELLNKTVVHELTHAIQGQINPVAPFWMIEGVAMYESEMFESVRERVSQGIKENNIPALASLEALDEEGFEQAGGYAYGYTVVEFSVETYGKEILPEWVKTPQEYERVFGVSGENFEKQWLAWLVDRYAEP